MARWRQQQQQKCSMPFVLSLGVLLLAHAGLAAAKLQQAGGASAFKTSTLTNVDKPGPAIPQSFLGFSHEWPFVEELYNVPGYMDIIRQLQSYGSGPLVLRIGGGSTDKLNTVPGPEVWDALAKLHKETGMTYIIGLNFYAGDTDLARRQMDAALKGLPAEAILSFEIGNEPNFYENKTGTHWNGTRMTASFDDYIRCCFHTEWYALAEALSCRNGPSSCSGPQFTGPVWGHLNLRNTTIDWFLRTNSKWVELASVHWYKATSETDNTPASLLDEDPIRKEMDNLAMLVGVSNSYGKPLRVAEMNTISNSGRDGVSNVFSSALWTLDGSLEVARAGATGVNLHQGAGQNLYAAVIRWVDSANKLQPAMLRPAFYGMMMLQQALRGGSRLLGQQTVFASSPNAYKWIKVHSLEDVNTKELRWVVINKDPSRAGTAVLRVNRNSGYAPKASVTRLLASGTSDPLSAKTGISLGGISYGNGGVINGKEAVEQISTDRVDGNIRITLQMPAGSAALVRLPKQ